MITMDLLTYLQSANRGEASRLARAVAISPTMISQYTVGAKMPAPHTAAAIERATNGAVTCEELRSDVSWVRIADPTWPHPKGRPLVDHSHSELTPHAEAAFHKERP